MQYMANTMLQNEKESMNIKTVKHFLLCKHLTVTHKYCIPQNPLKA